MPQHRLIDLSKITDTRGSLSFAQAPDQIPFMPARIFMLYDMPPGAERGGHAHHEQHQYVMMMHGGVTVEVDDGTTRTLVTLKSPAQALYVPPMLWLRLTFSENAACAVLASGPYDEADYIRNYDEFLSLTKAEHDE